jgi:hypothetical protein
MADGEYAAEAPSMKLSRETADRAAARVDGYVSKYMEMLGIDGERPHIKLTHNPRAHWLARGTWDLEHPHKSVLEFQTSLVQNDKNDKWLERSIAHEMIHYRDLLARAPRAKDAKTEPDHGASFHKGAARVNAIMGPDFVTQEVVKLPSGTFLSRSDLEAVETTLHKKLALVLGLGGLAVLGVALSRHTQTQPSYEHERGSYGTKRR